MAATRSPVEAKTQAAGVAGVVSGAVIYLLQTYVFKETLNPGLVSLIYAAVPGILAFAAAYAAPHQVRPGDPVPPVLPPVVSMTPVPPPMPPPTGSQL
jgi:hypothetical protein